MIVLDTTVLVYATGADHPLHDPCLRLLREVADGSLAATTTVEVLQEFAHVRARRRGRGDAVGLASQFADLLSPLLVVEESDLRHGLALYERSTKMGCFDAVLAATAIARGAHALVSADSAFAEAEGLMVVQPTELGVARLVAGQA